VEVVVGPRGWTVISLALARVVCACAEPAEQEDLFLPEGQTPLFERGLVAPPLSVPCVPAATGLEQLDCNHHGSSILELPGGDVLVSWFHGEAEKSLDSRLLASRRPAAGGAWSPPAVLFDDPGRAEGNSALHLLPDGRLALFFVTIFGVGWDDSRVRLALSEDQGRTWSAPAPVRDDRCWLVRTHPLRLRSGALLLPAYDDCLALPRFLRAADGDPAHLAEVPLPDFAQYLLEHVSAIQPAVVELADGALLAFTRDGGSRQRVHRMASLDEGLTWGVSEPTPLPNDGNSVDAVRLKDGHLVVVFNNTLAGRFPLAAALSLDEGQTFPHVAHLHAECDRVGCEYSYPSITQSPRDGAIWVSYTHNRETIGWIRFNEAWLMEHGGEALAE